MTSRWTKQRRDKRKFEEYIQDEAQPSTSTASTSGTTISSSGTISSSPQEAEREKGAIADTAVDNEEEDNGQKGGVM